MIKKITFSLSFLAALTAPATWAATLTVDNDGVQCPGAPYTSIQAAVTAANPGDTIRVCPGTYPEQVIINKNLKVEGYAVGNENLALIMPAGVVPNTTSLFGGDPIAAIIVVDGASNVSLTNLTVDGAANAINGCAPDFIGVYYRNSSGKMDAMAVRNIRLSDALLGCQTGLAIYAQSGPGGFAKLEVVNSSVHDYQKNGITANEAGTELIARGNVVTGLGSTEAIAQNGIQIGYGAKGTIEENSVINHVYGLCTGSGPGECDAVSTNILTFDTGTLRIKKNNLGKSQVNVYLETNAAEVSENVIFDTDVYDGVFVYGNNNKVQNNTIFNSDEAGVYVIGNNNKVEKNTINEAPVGVFTDGTGNAVAGNKFFNTALNSDSTATVVAFGRVEEATKGGATNTRAESTGRPAPSRP